MGALRVAISVLRNTGQYQRLHRSSAFAILLRSTTRYLTLGTGVLCLPNVQVITKMVAFARFVGCDFGPLGRSHSG